MRIRITLSTVLVLLVTIVAIPTCSHTDGTTIPDDAIVRISIGYYPPDKEEIVDSLLKTEFKGKIMPAVQKLNGNIAYYVAMDKDSKSLTNVSIWANEKAAMQMKGMQEMAQMAKKFQAMGVKFNKITNHQMVWQLPDLK